MRDRGARDLPSIGAFQFHGDSSDKPSIEGGFVGAVDRDLEKNAPGPSAERDALLGRRRTRVERCFVERAIDGIRDVGTSGVRRPRNAKAARAKT